MTSIVIMSTIGTTFSSAFVERRPCIIFPPKTFEARKRFAGRFPGWTIGIYPAPMTETLESPAPTQASMVWTRSA